MITPKNWMMLVASAAEQLPASARALVRLYPDVLEPEQCPTCGRRDFFVDADVVDCAKCQVHGPSTGTPVNLEDARPRVGFYDGGRRLASAILVRHESIDVVVPEAPNARFRVNSRTRQNSPSSLVACLVEVVRSRGPYRKFDLLDRLGDEAGPKPPAA